MMLDDTRWFTECTPGISFSLQIKSKLHQEHTPFQTITLFDTTHFGHLMVIDGFIMLSQRDNFLYHEMMSHPLLFSHPNPQKVVIIGGGDCGTLKEILKHPLKSAKQIEIDERVTRLAERYFPELCTANSDPRAQFLFQDGIQWMQKAPAQSEDLIIIDSTDPIGPAEGLFNQDFYRQCHRVLKKEGLLIQQSGSPLLNPPLIAKMRQAMSAAGFSHSATLTFPQPVYPSGWWSATLAAKGPLHFRQDHALLAKLETQYYQFSRHQAALSPLPFLEKALKHGI